MQVSRSVRKTSIFVLKWNDVQEIVTKFSERHERITISTYNSDNLDRKYSDLVELKNFPNSVRAAITELRISGRSREVLSDVSVAFNTLDRDNFRFTVDSDQDTATELNEYIEDLLERVEPWYSSVAKSNWTNLVLFSIAGYFGLRIALMLYAMGFDTAKRLLDGPAPPFWTPRMIGFMFFGFFAPIVLSYILDPIKRRYFPTGVFALGNGLSLHESRETKRTVVIAGFVISVLASIFLSFFL